MVQCQIDLLINSTYKPDSKLVMLSFICQIIGAILYCVIDYNKRTAYFMAEEVHL